MSTGGGLVFNRTPEGEFIGLDDETGEQVVAFQTGFRPLSVSRITWRRRQQ